ncbi:MAG: PKD domain-containing protein [Bacteroidota bacterium]|nr:PKD domain-containing protein [Bacteroidota bacterium]
MCGLTKILFLSCLFVVLAQAGFARHIKGGEIHYIYMGPCALAGTDKYLIRLRLFVSCQSTQGQLETEVSLGVFKNSNNTPAFEPLTATLSRSEIITLGSPSPCIINPSPVCYWIREYTVTKDIPRDPMGYTVIFQRCCRIDGIRNASPNVNIGATYSCQIQGTNSIGVNGINSNPEFNIKDTVLICQKRRFQLDYHATDQDGDSLTYEFSDGYYGGSVNNAIVTSPTSPNLLQPIEYASGFSGLQPLGPGVTINRNTGLISGLAPASGDYVVCVLLREYRNGVQITVHRKDFIIHVDDRCDFPSAALEPSYITCDGFNFSFQNESPPSPLVHSYYWDFGVNGTNSDTTSQQQPTFTFPDTGLYNVTLFVNKGELCSDSTSTIMKVYPGFFPGFKSSGICVLNPVQFTDTTKTRYGAISSWRWNFGDDASGADTSVIPAPSWKYSDTGVKNIQLIVSSSKGCMDTVKASIDLVNKPPISFPFRDTLICSIDTLQLHAKGSGNFSWGPATSMLNNFTADPLVFPKTTTWYTATLEESGCVNADSVKVRVVDRVTLYPGNDSTICLGDTAILNPGGDGLYFVWSPTASLDLPTAKNPHAAPPATTTYTVVASIGKCNTSGTVTLKTVPYPLSAAAADTFICWQDTAYLHATAKGIRYNWVPANSLSNPTILNPYAFPDQTTVYSLFVYDTLGCPKPGISQVTIQVNPQIFPFAGNDTSIVIGQPLQLHGSGAPSFLWYPPTGLDRNDIENPVAILDKDQQYIMKTFTEEGCFAYDSIKVKVFTTAPDIFVPNAFTPGQASNAIFRPIPVGISKLELFRVYNRNGMLVYSSTRMGDGWDGTLNGKPQASGGYVWMVQGVDYTGKVISKKGTMVLIR